MSCQNPGPMPHDGHHEDVGTVLPKLPDLEELNDIFVDGGPPRFLLKLEMVFSLQVHVGHRMENGTVRVL